MRGYEIKMDRSNGRRVMTVLKDGKEIKQISVIRPGSQPVVSSATIRKRETPRDFILSKKVDSGSDSDSESTNTDPRSGIQERINHSIVNKFGKILKR